METNIASVVDAMIPLIIHQIWINVKPMPGEEVRLVDRVKATAADTGCKWTLHTEVDAAVLASFSGYYEVFKELRLIEQVDIGRYCILFNEGGFYMDTDTEPTEKFASVRDFRDKPIIQVDRDMRWSWSRSFSRLPEYAQFFMGFPAGSEILRAVVEEAFRRAISRPFKRLGLFQETLRTTGPGMFTDVLWDYRERLHLFRVGSLVKHYSAGSWLPAGYDRGSHRLLIRWERPRYVDV